MPDFSHVSISMKLWSNVGLSTNRSVAVPFFEQLQRRFTNLSLLHRGNGAFTLLDTKETSNLVRITKQHLISCIGCEGADEAHTFHTQVLEGAMNFLNIVLIELLYIEVSFCFTLECEGDPSEIIAESMCKTTPFMCLSTEPEARVLSSSVDIVVALNPESTRVAMIRVDPSPRPEKEIVTVFTVRHNLDGKTVESLPTLLEELLLQGEVMCGTHIMPLVIDPIRAAIGWK